ncbi:hypothetical protein CHS0354_036684 [Potamilus streckersoni]|uniref:Uncharacterized protein n=1 Tax=Potamilus streckersoni TaxID=2493646 RepID=A0AAE0WE07_9BIVA|nr:hypothetical protein CHS0354_036684 [Potamilus streckersoni]
MDEVIDNPEILDDYEAAINLSNSCREFYFNRVKATAEFKQLVHRRTQRQPGQSREGTKTSLDRAMERLRNEMAELMDQDLSLMEQLLTLNERIVEVKTQFMYNSSCETMYDSTHNLTDSEQSLKRTSEDIIDLPSCSQRHQIQQKSVKSEEFEKT